MSSGERRRSPAFGLRLGLWYATLFVIGAIAIVFLTYYLTAASLAQRDRQIIEQKLGEYAAVYARGGLRALADDVRAEQRTAPERLFVRVVDRGAEALVLSMPEGWDPTQLETASLHARRRHARAGRQEHRGAPRSARAVSCRRSAWSRSPSSLSR